LAETARQPRGVIEARDQLVVASIFRAQQFDRDDEIEHLIACPEDTGARAFTDLGQYFILGQQIAVPCGSRLDNVNIRWFRGQVGHASSIAGQSTANAPH
jgi:hypothetical protein